MLLIYVIPAASEVQGLDLSCGVHVWMKACTEQGHAMLWRTSNDEGDIPVPVVINIFCSICSHSICVHKSATW